MREWFNEWVKEGFSEETVPHFREAFLHLKTSYVYHTFGGGHHGSTDFVDMTFMAFPTKSGCVFHRGGICHQTFMSSWQRLSSAVSTMASNTGHLMVWTNFLDTLMAGVASTSFFQMFNFTKDLVYREPGFTVKTLDKFIRITISLKPNSIYSGPWL